MAKKKASKPRATRKPKGDYEVYVYESISERDLDAVIAEIREDATLEYFKHDALPDRNGRTYTIIAVYRA